MAKFSFNNQGLQLSQLTNSKMRIGFIILRVFSVAWLLLTVIPIIMAITGARESVAHDPSSYGASGAVVFAMLFLSPVWAFMIAGWIAVPALIYLIIGGVEAHWNIRRIEWIYVVFTAIVVLVAVGSIPMLPQIIPVYFAL